MDHLLMILVACSAIGSYVYALKRKDLHPDPMIHRLLQVGAIFGIIWLTIYAGVELARSSLVWMSGKAGGNLFTSLVIGGSIAIHMKHDRSKQAAEQHIKRGT